MEDVFYVKLNTGWSKMAKIKNYTSNNDLLFGAGIGYHIIDDIRIELSFDRFANTTHKQDIKRIKSNISTLMLNGFFNIFETDSFKVFLGVGAGSGTIKTKYTNNINSNNYITEQKRNLAFAGYIGAVYELSTNIHTDLTYSYRDMGKTRKIDGSNFHYKGNNVSLGLRIDI
jgi:opacity protein-like surface antigen